MHVHVRVRARTPARARLKAYYIRACARGPDALSHFTALKRLAGCQNLTRVSLSDNSDTSYARLRWYGTAHAAGPTYDHMHICGLHLGM